LTLEMIDSSMAASRPVPCARARVQRPRPGAPRRNPSGVDRKNVGAAGEPAPVRLQHRVALQDPDRAYGQAAAPLECGCGRVVGELDRPAAGGLARGVMGVIVRGGEVRAGDAIEVRLPAPAPRALAVV